jgi:hypothetical protein
MATLYLTAERIREELFLGGFRPMQKTDFYIYADAEQGSLIADISVGRFNYAVLFTPSMGNAQIFQLDNDGFETIAFEIDLISGLSIQL